MSRDGQCHMVSSGTLTLYGFPREISINIHYVFIIITTSNGLVGLGSMDWIDDGRTCLVFVHMSVRSKEKIKCRNVALASLNIPRDHVEELQWKKMLLGDCIFPRESSLVPPQRRRQTKRSVIRSGLQSQEFPN